MKDMAHFILYLMPLWILLGLAGLCHGAEYSDEQIVRAIYLAEGGENAQYPYGIRSVKCSGESECRKVCLNTVRNNRKRFADYGKREFDTFIAFLASRFAPINAGNDPKGLNKYWLKNVNFFLAKGV